MTRWLLLLPAVAVACTALRTASVQGGDIETIYVVPTSHLDIGFTVPPSAVAHKMRQAVEDCLTQADADPAYVWQFENFWQLEQWLDGRPTKAQADRLLALLRSCRFDLSAAYATPHSCVMSAWALDRYFRLPVEWARSHGLHLQTAILNDVPGHPIDLPHFLARNGVRYLLIGSNLRFSRPLPDAVANTPFWWEAPTGERVLTWISSRSYTEAFMHLGIDPDTARFFNRTTFDSADSLEVMAKGIRATLDFYAKQGYPYDAIVAMHAFDNWGSRNSAKVPRYARLWNDEHRMPKIVPSTASAFFEYIESKYGPKLPHYRGGSGGQWDSVRCCIPTAMRAARRAEKIVQAATEPNPHDVRRLLVFYEHSFSMGATWPKLMTRKQAVQHNREQYDLLALLPGAKDVIEQEVRQLETREQQPVNTSPDDETPGLQSNTLYCLRRNPMFFPPQTVDAMKTMPNGSWLRRDTQKLGNRGTRVRHWIDRRQLPDPAYVVWLWEINEERANSKVYNRTATGWETLPDDRLAGYDWGGWTSPFGFRLGGCEFQGDGVLSFRQHRLDGCTYLIGLVLGQTLATEFKDEGRGELTFAEAYPGEASVVEASITIIPAGDTP